MIARTKTDVHVGTLSMEFGDTLVQFNIFKAMKHPTEDHSLFGIDLIDEVLPTRQPQINPSICMHRILMEKVAKPIRQQQRRMNPTILDMVKKEVTKFLAAGIIYPIPDSQWVSPMQVMPKKFGMTVIKNQHDELVPMRIQNNWRATHKDHFPLPFIDQVLEKLSGKSHYYFLDGFFGYMQIHRALEDQDKTTFTCPFGTFAYTRMPFGL
ncbi:hypothetical protein CR513_30561, partial [Mucuna pruriens]